MWAWHKVYLNYYSKQLSWGCSLFSQFLLSLNVNLIIFLLCFLELFDTPGKVSELLPLHLDLFYCIVLQARHWISDYQMIFELEYCWLSILTSRFCILSIRLTTSDNVFVFLFMISKCVYTNLAWLQVLTLYEDLSLWFVLVLRILVLFFESHEIQLLFLRWFCSSVCSRSDWLR